MKEARVSLLWPDAAKEDLYKETVQVSDRGMTDLGIEQVVRGICLDPRLSGDMLKLLLNLCSDPEVIQYRLDVMEDFRRYPEMRERLRELLPKLQRLESQNKGKFTVGAEPLRKIAWQVDLLSLYVECVTDINEIMRTSADRFQSSGMSRLLAYTEELMEQASFRSMSAELPEFRRQLQNMSSVTIGINLDNELRPVEAVFLSVEPKPFKERSGRSLIAGLLGLKSPNEQYEGISQFHSITRNTNTALESALFKDLKGIFEAAVLPIGAAIQKYIQVNFDAVTALEMEISFYLGGSRLLSRLESAGLSVCKPEVAPTEERACQIEGLVDMILAVNLIQQYPDMDLTNSIVANDVEFGEEGRIFIVTGPNQGGKTTYTRAIGLAQLLFQAGLFVLGRSARISPADWLFTHFSEEEKPSIQNGRLGEESKRLAEIYRTATGHSLILLNESLSSTSPGDSLLLARDVMKGIKLIGCRAVYATHLLELASSVEEINRELPGDSQLISVVAGVERVEGGGEPAQSLEAKLTAKRTYRFTPGPPNSMSYAKDIARLYGISFEQIQATLRERKLAD